MTVVDFAKIVEKDLTNDAVTEFERQALFAKPEEWRRELVSKLQGVDSQLTKRRSESLDKGTKEARLEYEEWKKRCVSFKRLIVARLMEVKEICKTKGQVEYAEAKGSGELSNKQLLQGILDEIS